MQHILWGGHYIYGLEEDCSNSIVTAVLHWAIDSLLDREDSNIANDWFIDIF